MSGENRRIVFDDVSKFYGEVLGVNRVNLSIPPGITGLVGPNGSGKTTMMNLMTGLLQPSQGQIEIYGATPRNPELLFRTIGYCTQHDAFPKGASGWDFIYSYLRVHGESHADATEKARAAIERVNLLDASRRNIAGYSKGMRQRIKLAQATAHNPKVLVLDEPLNGLDPMARAEVIALFRDLAERGLHVIISSHILHEVDLISDQVILLNEGYVVAEGDITGVRSEMQDRPLQILIRCDKPAQFAARVFELDTVVDVKMHDDRQGLVVGTRDADQFFRLVNRIVLDDGVRIEALTPADADVHAVYQYLIGNSGDSA